MNNATQLPYSFPLLFCLLLDFPESRNDCSVTNPGECVKCGILGSYFTGDSINDLGSGGHVLSMVIWILTLVLGTFATMTNSLIVLILAKRSRLNAFDILLLSLASFDLFSSVASVIGATGFVAFTDNWSGRGFSALACYAWFCYAAFFGRSGSTFMTVLITIERFLVIQFPVKSMNWFSPRKIQIMVAFVVGLAVFINVPWILSATITENDFPKDITSIGELPFVVKRTHLGLAWYRYVARYHDAVDFWLPLPILLLVNLGSFWNVRKFSSKRKDMNVNVKKEISAVNMFLPVVVVFFVSNVIPICYVAILEETGVAYRELYLGVLLSTAFAGAANLPIYYFKGTTFRKEVRGLMSGWLGMEFSETGKSTTADGTTLKTGESSEGEVIRL